CREKKCQSREHCCFWSGFRCWCNGQKNPFSFESSA
ncbi:MAG: hypothetical protein AVDCRST_MAG93-5973, partial [uncultured Chloroflexia bacterium]